MRLYHKGIRKRKELCNRELIGNLITQLNPPAITLRYNEYDIQFTPIETKELYLTLNKLFDK